MPLAKKKQKCNLHFKSRFCAAFQAPHFNSKVNHVEGRQSDAHETS